MRIAGRFRAVRHKDHALPKDPPRPLTPRGSRLDVRIWTHHGKDLPWLLVASPKRCGTAVQRNRFRRRVRMALLEVIRPLSPEVVQSAVVWVRPARGLKLDVDIPCEELKGQLRLAFTCWLGR